MRFHIYSAIISIWGDEDWIFNFISNGTTMNIILSINTKEIESQKFNPSHSICKEMTSKRLIVIQIKLTIGTFTSYITATLTSKPDWLYRNGFTLWNSPRQEHFFF